MRLVALTAAVFVAALISAANGQIASAEAIKQTDKKPEIKGKMVVVQSGDSLSKIAKENDSTYQRIFFANEKIENPDLIYPDTELRVPAADEELVERPLPPAAATPVQAPKQSASSPAESAYRPQAVAAPADSNINGGVWDQLAACESGGNWAINTGNGYYGGLQFTLSSWQAVGGQGYPHQASKAEQISRGQMLQARQGWGAWPACTAKLGIR